MAGHIWLHKKFNFEAAHFLPNLPESHQCRRVHGHSFEFELWISGEESQLGSDTGWLMDFGDIAQLGKKVVQQLDHRLLNDISGLENPTCERLAIWIAQQIQPSLPQLRRVSVRETCTAGCIYELERREEKN